MVEVLPIETPTLGDRSYLAHDGGTALVIDPQRDIDRDQQPGRPARRAHHPRRRDPHAQRLRHRRAGPRPGGRGQLPRQRRRSGPLRPDPGPGRRQPATIGGAMRLRVLATPGHTFTHLSYVLEAGGEVAGVFTGGSLLYGSTGRAGPARARATPPTLARAQYASAHRLARELPDSAEIFPTHGFGSFCAATQAQAQVVHDRAGEAVSIPRSPRSEQMPTSTRCSPGWTPGPPTTRTWAPPTPPGRRGPDLSPPRPGRRGGGPPPDRRPASGSSTCGTGSRSPPASCPARSASRSTAASPPTWAG